MDMTPTTAAEALHKDRATIVRACRGLKPVATKGKVKQYKLAEIVDALIATAVSGVAGVGAEDSNAKAFAKERQLKMKQQRIALERENAIAAGQYVLVEEAGKEVDRAFGVVRERLLGIPGSSAHTLAMASQGVSIDVATHQVREQLDAAISEALEELSQLATKNGSD